MVIVFLKASYEGTISFLKIFEDYDNAKKFAIAECEKCDLLNAIVYNNVDFETQIGIRDVSLYDTLGKADFIVYGNNYFNDLARKLPQDYNKEEVIRNWKEQDTLLSKEVLFL